MTKNEILNNLTNPKLVDFIIKELNEIQELPQRGLLAGQAVASMIFKYLKLDLNPIVNDIDIFFAFNYYPSEGFLLDRNVHEYFMKIQAQKSLSLVGVNELFLFNDYGQIKISTGKKYSIVGTTNFKKINKVFVSNLTTKISYSRESLVLDIIDSFDINCTQVGIDLFNKKIYFTEAFVLFLYTKQMEIVKYNTPVHSLFRLIRKNEEIGSFINLEEEKMLVTNMLDSYQSYLSNYVDYYRLYHKEKAILENNYAYKTQQGTYQVSTKLNDLYDKNIHIYDYIANTQYHLEKLGLGFGKKHLKQYESVKNFIPEFKSKKLTSVFNEKTNKNVLWFKEIQENELNTVIVNNSFANKMKEEYMSNIKSFNPYKKGLVYTKDYISGVEQMLFDFKESEQIIYKTHNMEKTFSTIYSLPIAYKSMKKTKSSTVHVISSIIKSEQLTSINSADQIPNNTIELLVSSILLKGFNNLDKFSKLNTQAIKSFIKKSKAHSELTNFYENFTSIEEVEKVNHILTELEKEFGVLVYGFLNRKNLQPKHFDYETLRKQLLYSQTINSVELKDRLIDIDNEKYSIKELIKGLELKEEGTFMGHCVGGYTYSVKNGDSIIIALNNKAIPKRMTIELTPKNKEDLSQKYRIVQLKGRFNGSCSLEESKELLIEINKVYPLIEMETDFKNSYVFGSIQNNQNNEPLTLDINDNDIPF